MKNTLKILAAVLALLVGSASYVSSAEAKMKGHNGKCMMHSSHGKCQMTHGHKMKMMKKY